MTASHHTRPATSAINRQDQHDSVGRSTRIIQMEHSQFPKGWYRTFNIDLGKEIIDICFGFKIPKS